MIPAKIELADNLRGRRNLRLAGSNTFTCGFYFNATQRDDLARIATPALLR